MLIKSGDSVSSSRRITSALCVDITTNSEMPDALMEDVKDVEFG